MARTPGMHQCPADHIIAPAQRAAGWSRRVRRISMNMTLGNDYVTSRGFRSRLRLGRLVDPSPALTWVFVDEQPDSINNGFLTVYTNGVWEDLPASYHNGACGFSFADGHSEIKKWSDPTVMQAIRFDNTYMWNGRLPIAPEHRADHDWFVAWTGPLIGR